MTKNRNNAHAAEKTNLTRDQLRQACGGMEGIPITREALSDPSFVIDPIFVIDPTFIIDPNGTTERGV